MNFERFLTPNSTSLTSSTVALLLNGAALIEKIPDSTFVEGGRESIGAQFRHCVEFVSNFLSGIKHGRIDYGNRERNQHIETNRELAISRLLFAVRELQALSDDDLERPLMITLDEIGTQNTRPDFAWTSAKRELESVHSHTVHHYALIAIALRARGVSVSESFGVANSTLDYWKSQSAVERLAQKS